MDITLKDNITPQWLAGLFDGEGSISVGLHGCSYNVIVNITQGDIALMGILMTMFPFGTINVKVPDAKVKRNYCFSLQWRGTSAKLFLEYIVPHLVLKRNRALAALELIKTLGIQGKQVSEEDKVIREKIFKYVRNANDNQNEENSIQ